MVAESPRHGRRAIVSERNVRGWFGPACGRRCRHSALISLADHGRLISVPISLRANQWTIRPRPIVAPYLRLGSHWQGMQASYCFRVAGESWRRLTACLP